MASEKGDLPQDTDSLPPNYATSEVFTDSPPPAYRKTNTVRLQITRVVCFTILAAGFLTGLFILAHTWITTNDSVCVCPEPTVNLPESARLLQASLPSVDALLVDAPEIKEITQNDMEMSEMDQESRQMDIPLPFDEEVNDDESEEQEDFNPDEDETDDLQSLVEEAERKVKLPVDLLFGNPALAGKDVQCKVEKKMQNLGAGILSKTIIVTCDDDNEDGEEETEIKPMVNRLQSKLPPPPMSLLAPILKMIAARANARLQRQMQPNPSFRRVPQPFMQPIGISVNSPFMQPVQSPFPRGFDRPKSFGRPIMASMSVQGSPNSPFPMNGPEQFDGNSIIEHQPEHRPFPQDEHIHHLPMGGPILPIQRPEDDVRPHFTNRPFAGPQIMPFHKEQIEDQEQERPFIPGRDTLFRPFPPRNLEEEFDAEEEEDRTPIKVIGGFPPQIPDVIKQIVSHIARNSNKDQNPNKVPIIAIKSISEPRGIDDDSEPPKSKLLLPFPFRGLKMPSREGRKLDMDFEQEQPSNSAPFPLPRGAIAVGMKAHVVPEAAGRALDSPVTLPSLPDLPPLRFFPGRLLRLPVPLQGRAITHMEVKNRPNLIPFVRPDDENEEKEIIEDTEVLTTSSPDFGPPRLHTVIENTEPADEALPEDVQPMPPFLRRFPPPPPQFAPEGRVGIIREIEADAELVTPEENREHHSVMMN